VEANVNEFVAWDEMAASTLLVVSWTSKKYVVPANTAVLESDTVVLAPAAVTLPVTKWAVLAAMVPELL
jgi:hypothetical protein